MAVVGHLHKIVFGGRLTPTETWSCSMHFLRTGTGPLVLPGLMASAFQLWFNRSTSANSIASYCDFLKGNELNPASIPSSVAGKPASKPFTRYLDEANVNQHAMAAPSPGMLSIGPPQLTLALSLTTGFLRGPAHQGRFYPPSGVSGLSADGRVTALVAQNCATSAAQLITDINSAGAGKVVVYSGIGQVTRDVTAVKCGRVYDTQRRRRSNLVEDYQSVLVA